MYIYTECMVVDQCISCFLIFGSRESYLLFYGVRHHIPCIPLSESYRYIHIESTLPASLKLPLHLHTCLIQLLSSRYIIDHLYFLTKMTPTQLLHLQLLTSTAMPAGFPNIRQDPEGHRDPQERLRAQHQQAQVSEKKAVSAGRGIHHIIDHASCGDQKLTRNRSKEDCGCG